MGRTVGIGHQDFERLIQNNYFYIDKTAFIREWWESGDAVTLITRPRRFGKTLNMSMLECFFSLKYEDRGDLFKGLSIWQDESYRQLQGSYPVISLSFANVKGNSFSNIRKQICQIIKDLYNKHDYLLASDCMNEDEKKIFRKVSAEMEDYIAVNALNALSDYLSRYYGKKVIILLDEYDTPMQEAYVRGFWGELAEFTRNLFNAAFKTNPYLERAVMTGITRVSKESVFSDLNNLEVVTTTSKSYSDSFGFTEEEVFSALDEYGMGDSRAEVKRWYDGFVFGESRDIYNPWSILNYLKTGKYATYWANTSSNSLVGKLIREGNRSVKQDFEKLMQGESITMELDERIVYDQLNGKKNAIWSLLLAGGYLKAEAVEFVEETGRWLYTLSLTNREVCIMFTEMIRDWFAEAEDSYNDFIKALLLNDLKAMNDYMNRVALQTFSFFDTGKQPSGEEPERFYHGFVLGLMVELADRYVLTSNRESGFGRYDVMLEPRQGAADGMGSAIIIEFKVQDSKEKTLEETAAAALEQIDRMKYETALVQRGIPRECIRKYGFAFRGKEVLIR
ncbi:MAG: ATP-binding protein [Firmicutes bacterium]|nr:ATP-binding protein [Bacillota bacterium]